MKYDYVYSICCFSGFHNPGTTGHHNRLQDNIDKHLFFIQNYTYLKDKKVCVILCQRGDNSATFHMLCDLAEEVSSPNIDIHIIVRPNWGMTVGTIWDCFQYCKENDISSDYWWTFDDDYLCSYWSEREELLNNGYNMVGQWECMSWGDWNRPYYIKCWMLGYKIAVGHTDDGVLAALKNIGAQPKHRCWTDGGFYMMKWSDLLELEDKAGCFMKVPNNRDGSRNIITTENDGYGKHGIMYGEVGFPTLMKSRGMRFCAFSGQSYLTERWDRVDLSQLPASGFSKELSNPFLQDKPDNRKLRCIAKVPPLQDITGFLLQHINLQPPEFPMRRPKSVSKKGT